MPVAAGSGQLGQGSGVPGGGCARRMWQWMERGRILASDWSVWLRLRGADGLYYVSEAAFGLVRALAKFCPVFA